MIRVPVIAEAVEFSILYNRAEEKFCAPSTSMLARLISIYVTYAEKNPQQLHMVSSKFDVIPFA